MSDKDDLDEALALLSHHFIIPYDQLREGYCCLYCDRLVHTDWKSEYVHFADCRLAKLMGYKTDGLES